MPPLFDLAKTNPELVVLVHGTKDSAGQHLIRQGVLKLAEYLQARLRIAWLECLEPTLDEVLLDCAQNNKHVIILPLLLFRAGHAKKDLPAALERVTLQFPNFSSDVASVVGDAEIMLGCWKPAFERLDPERDRVCFFGRGAKDPEALEACQNVILRLREIWPGKWLEAYAGLQKPSLPDALVNQPFHGGQQLFIPCLLFKGLLLDQAQEQTASLGSWLPVLGELPEFLFATARRWRQEIQDFGVQTGRAEKTKNRVLS